MYEVANNNYLENQFREFGPKRAAEYSWSNSAKKIQKIIAEI